MITLFTRFDLVQMPSSDLFFCITHGYNNKNDYSNMDAKVLKSGVPYREWELKK